MKRVASMWDGRETQGKTASHDGATRRRRVRVWRPGPTLRAGAPAWPTVLPPQIGVRSRSRQRFVDRQGEPEPWTVPSS
jgi:hypothetical protein